MKVLSDSLGTPYVRIQADKIEPSLLKKIPAKFVTHYKFIPLEESNGFLTIALNDPSNIQALDELELLLKKKLKPVISSEEDILNAIRDHYGIGAETIEKIVQGKNGEIEVLSSEAREDENIEDMALDASIIKFVNQIMLQAIKDRATDIHIEPFEEDLRVRYRIDGLLYEVAVPPAIKHFQLAIVSRVKIMADLNIAERRIPQDGRIKVRMGGEDFDLRISILPTPFGETVNIRILQRSSLFHGLEELGLLPRDLKIVEELIKRPHGIILVTGPTGSGKTTTLYACLSKINSPDRKIITIEDPIEYQLKGISQMQVQPKIGFTFATGLRSMLRHDPDIMMVGEIRDSETAEITIRTALTGHLVFSTLHTNDASGAVARLLDIGVEPYLASSSLEAVIAQRLVRKICSHCREEFRPGEQELREIGVNPQEVKKIGFYRGKGCEECKFTGYKGRTGIYEIFLIDEEIGSLIMERVPGSLIRKKAKDKGMRNLREDGWEKIKKGITTIPEVLRVTQEEEINN